MKYIYLINLLSCFESITYGFSLTRLSYLNNNPLGSIRLLSSYCFRLKCLCIAEGCWNLENGFLYSSNRRAFYA